MNTKGGQGMRNYFSQSQAAPKSTLREEPLISYQL